MNRQWMPLYVPDYLRDTGHLSTLEHGAYMLLIMHYWATGGLPDNEAQLARIARVTSKEWKGMRETLRALFLEGWRHKRVEEEIAEAQARFDRRSKAGQTAAESRWANASETDGKRIRNASGSDANATHNAGTRDRAQQSPSQSSSKIESSQPAVDDQVPLAGWLAGLPEEFGLKVRDAAGSEPCATSGETLKAIAECVADACCEGDVLEGIGVGLAKARSKDERVHHWAYFAGFIRIARDSRLAEPRTRNGAGDHAKAREGPKVVLKPGLPPVPVSAIRNALSRGTWYPKTWGPEPGKPGCLVPASLLKEIAA